MRVDIYLFNYRYLKSRQAAKVMIESGNVKIDGKIITKPAFNIDEFLEHSVEIINKQRFVSRGGEKLDFALDSFKINVENKLCIDVGASTGGFTDCLLQRGANHVYAVDSGHSQLDLELAKNERVTSIEKYNARFIEPSDFPCVFDIAVMDVSFISQTFIHKGINNILTDGGVLISLIKPQFECGKSALNSHGIVKKNSYYIQAINKVIDNALICGFSCIDLVRSPILGGTGNTEFLICLQKSVAPKNMIPQSKIEQIAKTK